MSSEVYRIRGFTVLRGYRTRGLSVRGYRTRGLSVSEVIGLRGCRTRGFIGFRGYRTRGFIGFLEVLPDLLTIS